MQKYILDLANKSDLADLRNCVGRCQLAIRKGKKKSLKINKPLIDNKVGDFDIVNSFLCNRINVQSLVSKTF